MTQIEYTPADVETFWSRVDKNGPVPSHRPDLGPCWLWTRAKAVAGGYGIFGPSFKRVYRAHRFSWTVVHGPIPAGMFICHHCDNPPCVRPDHLFLGTNQENMRDCADKGRSKLDPQRGEAHHSATVTERQVRDIRRRYAQSQTPKVISKELGVSYRATWCIVHRLTWKDVADHPEQQAQE